MKKYGTIYSITNKLTGKIYIGQTTQRVERRFQNHIKGKCNNYIAKAIKKYGVENFELKEIFIAFNKSTLNWAEKMFIRKLNTLAPNGYNLMTGGQASTFTKEVREKIAKAIKGKPNYKSRGRKNTREMRLNMAIQFGAKPFLGIDIHNMNRQTIYLSIAETRDYGFNHKDVFACLKGLNFSHKNHFFIYLHEYANPSGSANFKKLEHAQRLGLEPRIWNRILKGKPIAAKNLDTDSIQIFNYLEETKNSKFDPEEVSKVLKGKKKIHKNHYFFFLE